MLQAMTADKIRELSRAGRLDQNIRDEVFSNSNNLLLQSQILFDEGSFREALQKINFFLQKTNAQSQEYGVGLFSKSWTLRALGEQDGMESKHCNSELWQLAHVLNDRYLMALALFRRGDEHFCDGNLNEANRQWTEGLKLLQEMGLTNSYEYSYFTFHMGLLYRDQFGFKVAIKYLSDSLDKARSAPYPFLVRQVLTELFFCYFYQGDINSARLCFEQIKLYKRAHISEIDDHILSAYIDIFHRKFKGARLKLIKAQALVRKHQISKNRFDMYFHFAYLYVCSKNFKKGYGFMRGSTDPIYRLILLSTHLELSPNIEILGQYERLSKLTGITFHIEQCRRHSDILTKNRKSIGVNLSRRCLVFSQKEIEFDPDSLSWRLIMSVVKHRSLSKEDILKHVFEFNHYESEIHDQKVYHLISQTNKLAGTTLFAIKGSKYIFNSAFHIFIIDSEQVEGSLALRQAIIEILNHKGSISLKNLARLIGLKSEKALVEVTLLQYEGRVKVTSKNEEFQVVLAG